MSRPRRAMLAILLVVVIGLHVGMFAAGGQWRTMAIVLVVIDVISGIMIFGAISEARKLEKEER